MSEKKTFRNDENEGEGRKDVIYNIFEIYEIVVNYEIVEWTHNYWYYLNRLCQSEIKIIKLLK